MKGQFLAVESVLTFGLGLTAAIGIIMVFDTYSNNVYDTAEDVEAEMIQNQVIDGMNSLRPVKGEASKDIELPETAGNRDYTVTGENQIVVDVSGDRHTANIPASESIEGRGSGEITLIKTDEGYGIEDR